MELEFLPPPVRRCSACREIKSTSEFYPHVGHRLGRATKCKECEKRGKRLSYPSLIKNKETPEKVAARQANLRAAAMLALGGICVKCGFSDSRALQIDHSHGGGTQERRFLSWSKLYQEVIELPGKYQLLCANCNWIKRHEKREATGRPKTRV